MDKKVTPAVTLGALEAIIEGDAQFKPWANFSDIEILEIEGFIPDLNDSEYTDQLKKRMEDRIKFIESKKTVREGFDKLPDEALQALKKVVNELK